MWQEGLIPLCLQPTLKTRSLFSVARDNTEENLRVLWRSSFNVANGDTDIVIVIITVAVTVNILTCSLACGLNSRGGGGSKK